MHAANNFGGIGIGKLFMSGIPEDYSPTIADDLLISIPYFLLGLVFLILMLRDNKKEHRIK